MAEEKGKKHSRIAELKWQAMLKKSPLPKGTAPKSKLQLALEQAQQEPKKLPWEK